MTQPEPNSGDGEAGALGHEGELAMRRQLPSSYKWDARRLAGLMRPEISPAFGRFIEAQSFFFIATSDDKGACDCSFRGREHRADGTPLPPLVILNPREIVFPDFAGNGIYNSLGNIAVNPHIGMLFMDFERQRRIRVNGRATISSADAALREVWPCAQAAVTVHVEQVYSNCSARIPRMEMVPGSDTAY